MQSLKVWQDIVVMKRGGGAMFYINIYRSESLPKVPTNCTLFRFKAKKKKKKKKMVIERWHSMIFSWQDFILYNKQFQLTLGEDGVTIIVFAKAQFYKSIFS